MKFYFILLESIRKRSDSDIERTDSGIGRDIFPGRRTKQSWEDIVHKSSKHWSVVAASAMHWKEMALKSKMAKDSGAARRKISTPAITEDMVRNVFFYVQSVNN